MIARNFLALLLVTAPSHALAAGFSCAFDQLCVGSGPCVVLAEPWAVELDQAYSGFDLSVDGHEVFEAPLRIAGDVQEDRALFLSGGQDWVGYAERWLLTIRPNGDTWLSIHRTQAFGEIETRRGTCREKI